MNYPVTDSYLAERLRRALEELPVHTPVAHDLRELALFFEFRDNVAKLNMRDFERVADMAREYAERDERSAGVNSLPYSEMVRNIGAAPTESRNG